MTNVEQWRVELKLSLDSGGLGDEVLRVEHDILYRELCDDETRTLGRSTGTQLWMRADVTPGLKS